MAITFQKQPLKFFNVNEPAIFEFSSDEDLGVNIADLVADLQIKSLYSSRMYTIKNILPNYGTGVFRVDVSGYLKSLMLDNFEYRFESPNKQYTVEHFSIGVSIHSENGADIFGADYVFDSGYIFDTTFIFAEQSPSDSSTGDFYPVVGISQVSEFTQLQKDPNLLNILGPKYLEFNPDFENTVSVFAAEKNLTGPQHSTVVAGVSVLIPRTKGVATTPVSAAQIAKMYLPTLISISADYNAAIPTYGVAYKSGDCEQVLQFRFFTSYGGYCYFYTAREASTANRGKTDRVNNNFYNQQDKRSPSVQREVDYKERMNLTGIKPLELRELFLELLRSPKVEVLLPKGFTECDVTGTFNLRKFDFEYSLTVDVSNDNQMTL